MKRALLIGLTSLLAPALLVPAAQGAARLRQVQVPISLSPSSPTPSGTLTLRFVFKNKPRAKNKFTPRQLTRIDFSKVPLQCMNSSGNGTSQLLLTRVLDVVVKVTKAPQPAGKKPKPGRYAFRFSYSFTDFTGTLRGTIDKPNGAKKPREPRSQGTLSITDLDADPGHVNCNSNGLKQWGGLPLTGVPATP
jgi:hypothetical protein